jgi:hypothetical protein
MRGLFLAAIGLLSATAVHADDAHTTRTGWEAVKPIIELRVRSESVDQVGLAEDAHATTMRGRLGFETPSVQKTSLLAEAELIWPWESQYNSTVNGKTAFPVVADPEGYELNRLQLANTSLPQTTVILGRQRINLDDQRFVGNVGWRQNEQTFDSLRVSNKSIAHLTIDLAYIDQVNRVFGADSPVGRYHGDNYLANLSYQAPIGTFTGFAYFLDFDEAPSDSSQTLGLRFAGSRPEGPVALTYSAAYAAQHDRAANPISYQDDYYALELSGSLREYTLCAGVEILEGNGVKGFATPLATLHKFQGWADKFLVTPANGIDDRYFTAAYAKKRVGLLDLLTATASFHRYESERLAIDYGAEWDVQLQAKWNHLTGLLKYADYDARRLATDTRKVWAQLEYVW